MFAVFLLLPLAPALVSLVTSNPLRAVGACALLAPWLVFAYYTDCVRPYSGGGASMVYVAVLLWGTPSAILAHLSRVPSCACHVSTWLGANMQKPMSLRGAA